MEESLKEISAPCNTLPDWLSTAPKKKKKPAWPREQLLTLHKILSKLIFALTQCLFLLTFFFFSFQTLGSKVRSFHAFFFFFCRPVYSIYALKSRRGQKKRKTQSFGEVLTKHMSTYPLRRVLVDTYLTSRLTAPISEPLAARNPRLMLASIDINIFFSYSLTY